MASRRIPRRYLQVAIGELSAAVKDTVDDNYGQLSSAAIDAVGETVVELLRTWR